MSRTQAVTAAAAALCPRDWVPWARYSLGWYLQPPRYSPPGPACHLSRLTPPWFWFSWYLHTPLPPPAAHTTHQHFTACDRGAEPDAPHALLVQPPRAEQRQVVGVVHLAAGRRLGGGWEAVGRRLGGGWEEVGRRLGGDGWLGMVGSGGRAQVTRNSSALRTRSLPELGCFERPGLQPRHPRTPARPPPHTNAAAHTLPPRLTSSSSSSGGRRGGTWIWCGAAMPCGRACVYGTCALQQK
mgnify:CR=1 FL=1